MIARSMIESASRDNNDGRINLDGFYLGMSAEEALARIVLLCPEIGAKFFFNADGALSIHDKEGNNIAWTKKGTTKVSWLTLPPFVVKVIVGSKCKTFDDLEKAVQRKFGVNFKYSMVRKGDVFQLIGSYETVEGETLRYFRRGIGQDEDVRLAMDEKILNQNATNLAIANAFGGSDNGKVFADAINIGMAKFARDQENKRLAALPCFARQGALQLLPTKDVERLPFRSDFPIVLGVDSFLTVRNQGADL